MELTQFKHIDYPHNRYNPLNDEWVLVCPHRSKRPWQGQVEKKEDEQIEATEKDGDRQNPLAPGATRSNGQVNPDYTGTFAFDNDFPALIDPDPIDDADAVDDDHCPDNPIGSLFRIKPARGRCRVICFHPKTNRSLPLMTVEEIITVIDAWIHEFQQMATTYVWVQIFENRGAMMGCSNPHPHGQIWGSRFLPQQAKIKDRTQRQYRKQYGQPMLWQYVRAEIEADERIVAMNEHWVTLVPFWAVWPFETMIIPRKRIITRLDQLTFEEKRSLAQIMKVLLTKYDNLFQTSFPYSMAWHGAPTGPKSRDVDNQHWMLHAIYYPPLLRSADIKKFMVGYELAAQSQRDITPERAAEMLRQLPETHYRHQRVSVPESKQPINQSE